MFSFHFNSSRRRTAGVLLVVWLFAVAAGVVNACALTPTGLSAHAGVHADVAAHGSHHDDDRLIDRHRQEQPPGKDSCLKFCDEESSAIAKVKSPAVDPGSTLPTLAEPWRATVHASGAGPWQSPERPGSHGPPLVIRLLRLTL
jgi:hypothetical protein